MTHLLKKKYQRLPHHHPILRFVPPDYYFLRHLLRLQRLN
jgi:hypothetical protein